MGVSVGTIFKWFKPDYDGEACEDGQCIGIVEGVDTSSFPVTSVKWWEECKKHAEIDPTGTGPYSLDYIWQIGQLY